MLILINFLKSGLTTRELDRRLGHDSKLTKGWRSWRVLKRYRLVNTDKGRLFLVPDRQCRAAIASISAATTREAVDSVLARARPSQLDKYAGTFVIAPSAKAFCRVFSGETRNIIQQVFLPLKKFTQHCQYKGCGASALDTVHFTKDRPSLFRRAAQQSIVERAGCSITFDVRKTMEQFLQAHRPRRSVCFLCKKHHASLHREEKKSHLAARQFKSDITWSD
jgi:hypothetical protein